MTVDVNEAKDGGILRDRYGREQLVAVDKHAAPATTDLPIPDGYTDADGRRQIVLATPSGATLQSVASDVAVTKEAPINVMHSTHGGAANGDDTGNDATVLQAKLDAAGTATGNAFGGEVLIPGRHVLRLTAQVKIPYNVTLRGEGKGEFLQAYGASTIHSTYNGVAILVEKGRYGWAIRNLAITGDRSLGSQDLLTIGEGDNALPTLHGVLENVYISQAGRDNLVMDDALHAHTLDVYSHKAKRYCLRTAGQSNNLLFTKCQFREADEWGIYWGGGVSGKFDTCTVESNSRHATLSYGGLKIDPNDGDVAANISLLLEECHFEENAGVAGGGKPIRVEPGGRTVAINEVGTFYAESGAAIAAAHCSVEKGPWTSEGITTNLTTHFVNAASEPVVIVNPQKLGGGAFAYNDITGTMTVIGGTGRIGAMSLPAVTAASVPNNSLFRDSADGKLKWKDNAGTVNALY